MALYLVSFFSFHLLQWRVIEHQWPYHFCTQYQLKLQPLLSRTALNAYFS
ncbi:hypothetical protein M758_11G055800 [Ceratodon purpureus]|nr:hypothetical protein M758_11G055800 [Ceratodon purpureus]